MTIQIINTGSGANSRDGDSIRSAFTKVNNNFLGLTEFLSTLTTTSTSLANIGAVPPQFPVNGMLWYDDFGGRTYIYYDSSWIDTNPTIPVAGYVGSRGVPGYAGSQGITGYIGSASTVIGYTGSQGPIGYSGSTGTQGFIGYTGSQGEIGNTGSTGTQGEVGFTGSQGAASIVPGSTGYTGSTGTQGPIGFTGSTGTQGPIGFTGSTGTQGEVGVTGYTGSTGTQGVVGYTGSAGSFDQDLNTTNDVTFQSLQLFLGTDTVAKIGSTNGSVSLGKFAGADSQGVDAVAIGTYAGSISQGDNSIALGYQAGQNSQHANSIVINATTGTLNGNANAGLYIDPVRNDTVTDNVVYYNTSTKELTYGTNIAITKAGDTPPSVLNTGTTWYDSTSGRLFIYFENTWVDASPPRGSGPTYKVVAPPTTSASTGIPGQVASDATYMYVCVATDTWVRSTIVGGW